MFMVVHRVIKITAQVFKVLLVLQSWYLLLVYKQL